MALSVNTQQYLLFTLHFFYCKKDGETVSIITVKAP